MSEVAMGESRTPPFYRRVQKEGMAGTYEPATWVSEFRKDHDPNLAVIVGSGPSLAGFQWSQLRRPYITTFAINDEAFRNREHYHPDWWIFYDTGVLDRFRAHDLPPSTRVLSRGSLYHHAVAGASWPKKPVPEWLDRIVGFEVGQPYKPYSDKLFLRKTTATAAICAAVLMGFKHIALLGVDCYTQRESYYYTGTKPAKINRRGMTPLDATGNRYTEDRHLKMMTDFTLVAKALEREGWQFDGNQGRGRIYQCSPLSPLSCFEKVNWDVALHRYGR